MQPAHQLLLRFGYKTNSGDHCPGHWRGHARRRRRPLGQHASFLSLLRHENQRTNERTNGPRRREKESHDVRTLSTYDREEGG